MKIIVLDLDDTLIKTYPFTPEVYTEALNGSEYYRIIKLTFMKSSIKYDSILTYSRPKLKSFLYSIRNIYDLVCVWTAGTENYAKHIVQTFFPYSPYIVWSRNEIIGGYKNLELVRNYISDEENINPEDIEITMVDDIEENCYNSDICYVIPKYKPHVGVDKELNRFLDYINSII